MKIILTQAIVIIVLSLTTTINLHGQVTIGSNNPPRSGALLDLTEGSITTKGLSMPRVELYNIKPTTPAELSASIGGTGNWILSDHIGLTVYNSKPNHCAVPDPIYEGMYVFNGTEWEYLEPMMGNSSDVDYYEDTRTQVLGIQRYPYRTFGTAGTWMLENLRYIPDNTDPEFTGFSESAASSTTNKYWIYPWKGPLNAGSSYAYNSAQAKADWEKDAGILYNWPAATNGRVTGNIQEGEGQPQEGPTTAVQGICPPNWHVPTDKEWNQLEEAIYNDKSTYSQYTAADASDPVTWDITWNTTAGRRGSTTNGHGLAMLSECSLNPTKYPTTGGKSFPTAQGGFAIKLAGAGHDSNGTILNYGQYAHFWTISALSNIRALNREIGLKDHQMYRNSYSRSYRFSVRCKKD